MVRSPYFLIGSLMFSLASYGAATSLDCQSSSAFENNLEELTTIAEKVEVKAPCKKPTPEDFKNVCDSIAYQKPGPTYEIGFQFQEDLWNLSCTNVAEFKSLLKDKAANKQAIIDARAVAKKNIQAFWLANRADFSCRGYTGFSVPGGNVMKFSMDKNFPGVIMNVLKLYDLDMNFKDPADHKTLLDFVEERMQYYRSAEMDGEVKEYERVRLALVAKGAKRASEL